MSLPRLHRHPARSLIVGVSAFAAVWSGAHLAIPLSTANANQLAAVAALRGCALAACGYIVSTGDLGPLYLGPSDAVVFNTDTGDYSINGGPPIPGGVPDANGAMVFNFTEIQLFNTTAVEASGTAPLALASTGSVVVGGPINLRGCPITVCGTVTVAGGGMNGAGGNVNGQGGNGGHGGRNGQNLPGGQGGLAGQPSGGSCPNRNGGGGGGGGGGFCQINRGLGGLGTATGGGGGGEGGATGNAGGAGQAAAGGAGGSGGSASGGDGGNGSANGGAAAWGFGGTPCIAGGGGGGGGGGAVGANNGGNGGNGGWAGGGGAGGGGTVCGNLAGNGGNGAGGRCATVSPFPRTGPLLGGGGGGGAGGKSRFGVGTYAPSGGAGGGAIAIDSLTSITFVAGGLIDARGGDASPMGSMGDGAGGGGGGGAVCLGAPVVTGAVPGYNVRVEGGANSLGQPGDDGVFTAELIATCDPDNDIVATTSCGCYPAGDSITFTLENDSANSIYLRDSGPFEIRDAGGQAVYRPACVFFQFIEIPPGGSQNFVWDQTDMGDGSAVGCQWNNAAEVADGDYTFAVAFCTDSQCAGDQSVRCLDFEIGSCVTVTTDKDCYASGEPVTITITNNGCTLINLLNLMPWEIRDESDNLVYRPACVLWQILPINAGESHTLTLGGGINDGSATWDQRDDGDAQFACGYQNRAQVPNGTYQACVTYADANFLPVGTVCSDFKIANNCVSVDPDCPCNMLGGPVEITITNGSSQPIGLPNEQPWRILSLTGNLVYAPSPSGPTVPLDPGQWYTVYWDQNDMQGQPAASGSYSVEFDYVEMPNIPRIGRGSLRLGGCLRMTLDQDCYSPGADVTIKVVNTSCQQLKLTLCDVGPVMIVDAEQSTVWTYPCDTACNDSRIMQPNETRSWIWDQTDLGDGTHTNCDTWNNAQQVADGHYCVQVPYADVNLQQGFIAQQCLDISADCADLVADEPCHEEGQAVCFTLSNNTGDTITVDKPWRILDASGVEVHPGNQCFIFWIPAVIADGSCRQFCWDQQTCFTPPALGPGSYTFEIHCVEADGSEHTYREDFGVLAAGGCEPPPPDCNNNGTPDSEDIAGGVSLDCNQNLLPDECEYPACPGLTKGDTNCDGDVDGADIPGFVDRITSGAYTCQADLDGDGLLQIADLPGFVSLLLCWPNCPPSGPSVRSDNLCYVSGQATVIHVDTVPATSGSIHFMLYEDLGNGSGALLFEETRSLDGSTTYNLSPTLPNVGRYMALAQILGGGGEDAGADSLVLGARPDLPGIPSDICTFEVFTVDASALRSLVETAIAAQSPMPLQIGSRSFEVILDDASDLVSPSVLAAMPTLRLVRGQLTCNAKSEVRLTFIEGLVHGLVDQGESEAAVYLEPAYAYNQAEPPNRYIGYQSDDVRFPAQGLSQPFSLGPAVGGIVVVEPDICPLAHRVDINLYWDNDPFNTRIADFNNIDATYTSNFPTVNGPLLITLLYLNSDVNLVTDNYADDPGLLLDFTNDPLASTAGVDAAMLMTDNAGNINYGNFLGRAWWLPGQYAGANRAYSWVKRADASAHQRRIVGCHELAHNLGASNNCPVPPGQCPEPEDPEDITGQLCACQNNPQCGSCQCAHNSNSVRRHDTICVPNPPFPPICLGHDHYSIMKCVYDSDEAIDPVWVKADRDTLRKTIKNTAGHFCNP